MSAIETCVADRTVPRGMVLFNAISKSHLWDMIADDTVTKVISTALLDAQLLDAKEFWEIRILATEKNRFQTLALAVDMLLLRQRCVEDRQKIVDVVITTLYTMLSDRATVTFCTHWRLRLLLQLILSCDLEKCDAPEGPSSSRACVLSQPLALQVAPTNDDDACGSPFKQFANERRRVVNTTSVDAVASSEIAGDVEEASVNIRSKFARFTAGALASGETDCSDYDAAPRRRASCEKKLHNGQTRSFAPTFEERKREEGFTPVCCDDRDAMELSRELNGDYGAKPNCKESKRDGGGAAKQKVTVKNGEINDVLERRGCLKSLSSLDKLRDFSSRGKNEDAATHCDVTNGDSDGGFVSHDEDDIRSVSSFASGSSFSSEILNGWLNEEEFDSRHDSLLGSIEANATVAHEVEKESRNTARMEEKRFGNTAGQTEKVLEGTGVEIKQLSVAGQDTATLSAFLGDSEASNLPEITSPNTTRPTEVKTHTIADPGDKATTRSAYGQLPAIQEAHTSHRDVFWSIEHELRSTVDFRKVLPDLLKFNIFTNEQKSRYQDFEGQYAGAILHAVGERVDQNESVMGPFLLALRPHYPGVVDRIHQKVFQEVHSQRYKIDVPNKEDTRKLAAPYRRIDAPHQVSPYARRNFTINSARDQGHVSHIQKHYVNSPTTSRYFSKDNSRHKVMPAHYEASFANKQPPSHATTYDERVRSGTKELNSERSKESATKLRCPERANDDANNHFLTTKTEQLTSTEKSREQKGNVDVMESTIVEAISAPGVGAGVSLKEDESLRFPTQSTDGKDNHSPIKRNVDEELRATSNKPDTEMIAITASALRSKAKKTSVKRSSSFQEGRTRRGADPADSLTTESKAKRSELLKNYFEQKESNKTRLRSLSFSQNTESNQDDCDKTQEKLQNRFECSASKSTAVKNDENDPDAVLAELVKRCVVSARSGWLIRRFPNVTERRCKLLAMLAELPDSDVTEIKESCPTTLAFVKYNCGLGKSSFAEVLPQGSQKYEENDAKVSSTSHIDNKTTSPALEKSEKNGAESAESKANSSAKVNAHNNTRRDEDGNDGIHSAVNRKISNYEARSETRRGSKDKEREEIHLRVALQPSSPPEAGLLSPKTAESSQNFSSERISVGQYKEGRLLHEGVDFVKQQLLSDSSGSVMRSKADFKLGTGDKGRRSVAGHFVSHVLFPISKRKNAENQRSLKNFEEKKQSDHGLKSVQDSEEKTQQQIANLSRKVEAMSPGLSVEPGVCDITVDENFNLCTKDTPSNLASPPPRAILTNGGSVSPPSSKKKGTRVSFSKLPPIEIELEPREDDWCSGTDCHSTEVTELVRDSVATLTVKSEPVGQENAALGPSGPMKPVIVAKNKKKKPVNHSVNEIDQINELLMDILEEIEGESVSLNQYLHNLVKDGLMTEEVAVSVSPNFPEFQARSPSPTEDEYYHSDLEKERGVEKLLDVLTNLGLEKLLRCRNCLLGRLCQLSTYEDFESAQKAAAAASDSSPELSNNRKTFETFPSSNTARSSTPGRIPSVEECELSATESDDDFHFLRHQIGRQRYDVSGNPTIEEEDETPPEMRRGLDHNQNVLAEKLKPELDIKATLPILIDENVLAPRHAWLILGAGGEKEQKSKLKQLLSRTDQDELQPLYSVPHLSWLKTLMEGEDVKSPPSRPRNSFTKARDRFQRPASKLGRSLSLRESDLQKKTPPSLSDVAHLVEEHVAARKEQEKRLSPPLEALLKRQGGGLRRAQSMNAGRRASLPEEKELDGNLERWCHENKLSPNVAPSLRKSGYHDAKQLRGITEGEIERLDGASWMEKTKIWVAVENMRLEEFYRRTHSDLADIMKFLDK